MTEPRAGTVNRGQRSRPLIFPPTLSLHKRSAHQHQQARYNHQLTALSRSLVNPGCQEAVDVTGRGPGPPRPVCCYDGDPEVLNNTQRERMSERERLQLVVVPETTPKSDSLYTVREKEI